MSADRFDPDSWLARIGYAGSRAPSLGTLQALITAHVSAIPFECIDVFLGRVPALDIETLQKKMIAGGRGGYCYEQNMLFRAGLAALGFSTVSLMARVLVGLDAPAVRPATHMALRVDLAEGPFLVDVGFGAQTPTTALAMRPFVEQATPHEVMRLVPSGEDLIVQAKAGDAWQSLYQVSPQPKPDVDYEVVNWYNATYPGSLFVNNIIVTRPGSGGLRYALLNDRLSTRRAGRLIEQRQLGDAASYAAALRQTFHLALSDSDFGTALAMIQRKSLHSSSHTPQH